MTLLQVTEHDPLLLAPHFSQKGSRQTVERVGLNIVARDGSRLICPDPSLEVTYLGDRASLAELIDSWANDVRREGTSRILEDKAPGEHNLYFEFLREFPAGELEILGKDIEKVSGGVDIKAFIFHHLIEYSFDVESRGRVISFTPVQLPDGDVIKSRFVITYKDRTPNE